MPTSPAASEARKIPLPVFAARRSAVALLAAGTFLAACTQHTPSTVNAPATTTTQAAPTKKTPAPRTIIPLPPAPEQRLGVVKVIGARASFVLIETPSASVTAAVPAGHILHCHPPGITTGASTADLRVSTERRQPFVIADVLAGTPSVGDVAYLARDDDSSTVPIRPVVPFSSVIPAAEPPGTPASTP